MDKRREKSRSLYRLDRNGKSHMTLNSLACRLVNFPPYLIVIISLFFNYRYNYSIYCSNILGFQISSSVLVCMTFLASSFVVFLVQERANKAKHVQFVSGVDPFSYWGSAYTWDLINFLLLSLSILILVAACDVPAYTGK